MTLAPGTRLGPYDILAALGAGGMGEVYRARDTRLGRDVALKILPTSVAADKERLGRFDREARLLASLTHQHIATLHALEHIDGRPILVMELVGGEDLSQRIDSGPLTVAETVRIALQIALALEAAHDKGVVHRDLKPANIKLTDTDDVKVLDFGLAKAFTSDDPSSASAMNSPTITSPATAAGIILGTAAYMSPEQARGRTADKRADIWAFGVVVFEMLTGRRLFQGETISDTLAAVLRQDIDLRALPAETPAELERLLRRCLERDPKRRLHDIADARIVLEDISAGRTEPVTTSTLANVAAPRRTRWGPIVVTGVAALVIGGAAMRWMTPAASAPLSRLVRFSVTVPGAEYLRRPAVAPDGSFVVFEAGKGVDGAMYIQRFNEPAPRLIEHTQSGGTAVISADSRWIAFLRHNGIEKVSVDGGNPVSIAQNIRSGPGIVWLPDGNLILPKTWVSGLMVVSADGKTRMLTTPDASRNERSHWYPTPLPDGRHILFTVLLRGAGLNTAEVAWLDVTTGKYQVVIPGALGYYVAPGHLIYLQAGAMWAVGFDPATGKTHGEPVRVLEDARTALPDGETSNITTGADGTIAYVLGPRFYDANLFWVSPGGATEKLNFPARPYLDASLSPDGRRALVGIEEGGRYRLHVLDLDTGRDETLDLDGNNWHGVWHSNGHQIAFLSQRKGDYDAYLKDLATSERDQPLLVSDGDDLPLGWFADDAMLVSHSDDDGIYAAFRLEPGQSNRMTKLVDPGSDKVELSPDRRWLGFANSRSERLEAYVAAATPNARIESVSTKGAQAIAWSLTAKELYFARPPEILAAPYREEGGRLVMGPERLWARVENSDPDDIFDVGKDGRILIDLPVAPPPRPEIRVILGWQQELVAKLAARR